MKIIHINWEGPKDFNEVKESKEKGIYQIYGNHINYGCCVILYIGKTGAAFNERLNNEEWHWADNESSIRYYLGKIDKTSGSLVKETSLHDIIKIAEKILIYAHSPACNSVGVKSNIDDCKDYMIYNWGNYGMLMPSISADRFHSSYWTSAKFQRGNIQE